MEIGFLLERGRTEVVSCRFCGGPDGDGHRLWECTDPPFVHISVTPEFHGMVNREKSNWHRCLLWHGWRPALACPGGVSPCADSAENIASNRKERAHGAYSESIVREWNVDQRFLDGLLDSAVADDPHTWTDGSLVLDDATGIASEGAGVFSHASGSCWFHQRWGQLDLLPRDGALCMEKVCSL